MTKKVIYASDYRGIELRKRLIERAYEAKFDVMDLGIPDGSLLDYIDISKQIAEELRIQPDAIGVMTCGSGQGVAIALNRFAHIRACMCRTVNDAMQTREKLNANVICLGSKQNTFEESSAMVETFISTPFGSGKHIPCVQKLASSPTNHVNDGINLIVRAIIIHESHILLSTATESNRDFAQNLYFLPGGHVDYNEPAVQALKRELLEEMNFLIESTEFKGVLECSWDRKGKLYHELNLVYQVKINGLDIKNPPIALDHGFQKFIWWPITKLEEIFILPESLKPLIYNALNDKGKANFYSQMSEKEMA